MKSSTTRLFCILLRVKLTQSAGPCAHKHTHTHTNTHTHTHTHVHTHLYTHTHLCVCACVIPLRLKIATRMTQTHTPHTHTHTHTCKTIPDQSVWQDAKLRVRARRRETRDGEGGRGGGGGGGETWRIYCKNKRVFDSVYDQSLETILECNSYISYTYIQIPTSGFPPPPPSVIEVSVPNKFSLPLSCPVPHICICIIHESRLQSSELRFSIQSTFVPVVQSTTDSKFD